MGKRLEDYNIGTDTFRLHADDAPVTITAADTDMTLAITSDTFLGTLPDHPRETIEHGPLEYRLAFHPDGVEVLPGHPGKSYVVLQGRYRLEDTSHGGLFVYGHRFEWRDLPTVVVGTQVEEPA